MRDQGIPLPNDAKIIGPIKKIDTVVLKAEMNGTGANEAGEGKPQ
jgi:hypothetical protein